MHTMGVSDLLTLLTIIIALSAYLATIRLLVISRLSQASEPIQSPPESTPELRNKLKRFLLLLALADAPLVTSGLLLGLHIFWQDLTRADTPPWFLPTAIVLFGIAGLILYIYHLIEWVRSLWEGWEMHRERRSRRPNA
jgi:hypothetical protein